MSLTIQILLIHALAFTTLLTYVSFKVMELGPVQQPLRALAQLVMPTLLTFGAWFLFWAMLM